jgi:hypothetical protein
MLRYKTTPEARYNIHSFHHLLHCGRYGLLSTISFFIGLLQLLKYNMFFGLPSSSPLDIIELFYLDRKLKLFNQIQQVYCVLYNKPNGLTLEEIKNIFISSINHFGDNP